MRLEFSRAEPRVKTLVDDIIRTIPEFSHIDPERIHILFSNSTSRSIAYCHEMNSRIQFALDIQPNYVIELVTKNWKRLSIEERAKVLIHELYHIPRTFSGYLRNHDHRQGFTPYSRRLESRLYDFYLNNHPARSPEEISHFTRESLSKTPLETFI